MNFLDIFLKGDNGDPPWRIAAYWLVIFSFFSLPLVFWVTDLFTAHPLTVNEFSYVWRFHALLGGMLVSILGLNSLDRYFVNKNGNGNGEKK